MANSKLVTSCSQTKKTTKSTTWQSKTGTFTTDKSVQLENVQLLQFTTKRRVDAEFHLFKKTPKDKYDFILGRDFLQHIGLDIINSKHVFAWGGIEVDMLLRRYWNPTSINKFWTVQKTGVKDEQQLQAQESIKQVEYSKADLEELVKNLTNLDSI